jgi:hypothetical protein
MLSNVNINLKKELYNSQKIKSKLNEIILSKENDLKSLYEKKIKFHESQKVVRKNIESLRSEFIILQKKLIDQNKEQINKLIKNNKAKDDLLKNKTLDNKNLLLEKDQKINFYKAQYADLSSDLLNTKKKYAFLNNNLSILELEKNEILNKVMKLNNSVNSENIIEIKQENLSDNTEINNLKRIYKSKKTKNLVIDKDNLHKVDTDKTHLDNIIHKIFE